MDGGGMVACTPGEHRGRPAGQQGQDSNHQDDTAGHDSHSTLAGAVYRAAMTTEQRRIRSRLMRAKGGEEQRATNLELFFDLVYVFAVTQLSHLLGSHLGLSGAAQTALLLLVVWWAWVYTTWMTNWFDPDSPLVRMLLIAVMLASLAMAIAIPTAFGDRALVFALGYTCLQVMRNSFVVWATEPGSQLHEAFVRISAWSVAVGVLWVGGALADDGARAAIWIVALLVDYAGPAAGYWVPRLGRTPAQEWEIEGSHFAERFQLFIIIALGESVVVTGSTAAAEHIDVAKAVAIATSFLTAAALWWLYFDYVATIAQRRLATSDSSGALARDAYTYVHAVMVAGIIVAAVGAGILIDDPTGTPTAAQVATLAGGPALYLLGHILFRLRMAGSLSGKRISAAAAICVVGLAGTVLPALVTGLAVLAVLVVLIAAETVAGVRRRRRQELGPLEALEAELAGGRRDEPLSAADAGSSGI
jgi:low temperature requirement protein LtrA